jgi:glucose-1-phosphate cytidylyltransferase
VQSGDDGLVTGIGEAGNGDYLINGGFFVLRQRVFDVIGEGEELVEEPFRRLIEQRQLGVYRYRGFWQSMDTFKDKITLDRMEARGDCPWMVWKRPRAA